MQEKAYSSHEIWPISTQNIKKSAQQEKASPGLPNQRCHAEIKAYGVLAMQDEVSHSDFWNVSIGSHQVGKIKILSPDPSLCFLQEF